MERTPRGVTGTGCTRTVLDTGTCGVVSAEAEDTERLLLLILLDMLLYYCALGGI